MNLIKFNSFKISILITLLHSFTVASIYYSMKLLIPEKDEVLLNNCLIILALGILLALSTYFQHIANSTAIFNITMDIRQKITKHLINTPFEKVLNNDSANYTSMYINNTADINEKYVKNFLNLVNSAFLVVFYSLALIKLHYLIFLTAVVTFIISMIMPKLFEKRYSEHISNVQKKKGLYLSKITELAQGFITFKENNNLNYFDKKQRQSSNDVETAIKKQTIFTGLMSGALAFTAIFTLSIAIIIISILMSKNLVGAGALISATAILSNLNFEVGNVMNLFTAIKSSRNFIDEQLPFLKDKTFDEDTFIKSFTTKNIYNRDNFDDSDKEISTIKINDIEITFNDKKVIFNDNFAFEKNKKYALVGKSGTGKSSLLKIITGHIADYDGSIIVDGVAKDRSTTLFNAISYINQQTFIINATLAENIAFGDNYDKNKINDLLTIVGLENFNSSYKIEENGKNLSGGQKQKIAIARALYRNKDFIILDEATSSLDKESRLQIENYLLALNKTIIMISHNLDDNIANKIDKIYNIDTIIESTSIE